MNSPQNVNLNRRDFLAQAGLATSALAIGGATTVRASWPPCPR